MTYAEQLYQMVKEETVFPVIVPLRPEQCAWYPGVAEQRAANHAHAAEVLERHKKHITMVG